MAKSGLKHIDVGPELTKTEWESEESHELIHGTSFPASPVERQLFYRDDEHKWYIYNGSAWVDLQGGGGAGTFLQLTDTPSSYSGQAGKLTRVKSSEDGLEFANGGADLYALTRFLLPSRYHVFPGGTNTPLTLTANQLYAVPFFTPVARTVTRLAIHVTTLVAGNARLGIYQDNGSIYPGDLVLDAGTVDTGTTGLKEITGLNISFSANTLYWIVLVANAAPAIAAISSGLGWSPLGYGTSLITAGSGLWTVSYTYGTLPATFPGGATASTIAIPKIAVYF